MKAAGSLPYNQWPVLEVDGALLSQSMAIVRFLGARFGLAGDNDIEAAEADSFSVAVYDFAQALTQAVFAPPEEREAKVAKLKSEIIPKWLAIYERHLTGEFLVGKRLSYADISLFSILGLLQEKMPEALQGSPKLGEFFQRIASRPGIKKFLASKQPAKYKLYYWNAKGRAEVARLIFAEAGIEYTDVRAADNTEFEAMQKAKQLPFDQWPALEVNGKILAQSTSVARFLATRFGLQGANDIEKAQADAVSEALYDVGQFGAQAHYAPADKKDAILAKFTSETLPKFLGLFERNLTGEFVVGKSITYADLYMFEAFRALQERFPGDYDAYPKLKAHSAHIAARPNIKKHLEKA